MKFTDFRHWSPDEIEEIRDCREPQSPWDLKPRGLYFAPGSAWIDWCEREGFYFNNYLHQYQINTVEEKSILMLNPQNVKQFYETYELMDPEIQTTAFFPHMDWNKVKSRYKGLYVPASIIRTTDITLDRYYYIWTAFDVETLVIWDKTALKIERVK